MSQEELTLKNLKADAQKLNEGLKTILAEAGSYKKAKDSFESTTGLLQGLCEELLRLSENASNVITKLDKLDSTSIVNMQSDLREILNELSFLKDTLKQGFESVTDNFSKLEKTFGNLTEEIKFEIKESSTEVSEKAINSCLDIKISLLEKLSSIEENFKTLKAKAIKYGIIIGAVIFVLLVLSIII